MSMQNGLTKRIEALESRQGGRDGKTPLEGVIAAMAVDELRDVLDADQFSHLVGEVFDKRERGELYGTVCAKLEEWRAVFERCGSKLTDAQLEALTKGYYGPAKDAHHAAKMALAVAMREASLPLPGFLASLA